MAAKTTASSRLREAIARLARAPQTPPLPPLEVKPGCAFGAGVAERQKALEQGIGEVKGRLNSLIFVVIGSVIADLVSRLVS